MSTPAPPIARRVVVRGQVQGVFFRSSTRHAAQRHGVAGWVCNRADGTVEAWLEGGADAVHAVEAWIRAGGPAGAEVVDIEVHEERPVGHRRFEVRAG